MPATLYRVGATRRYHPDDCPACAAFESNVRPLTRPTTAGHRQSARHSYAGKCKKDGSWLRTDYERSHQLGCRLHSEVLA